MKAIKDIKFQTTPSIGSVNDERNNSTFNRAVITIQTDGDEPNVFKIGIEGHDFDVRTFLMVGEQLVSILKIIGQDDIDNSVLYKE